jgi:hypothetical protein
MTGGLDLPWHRLKYGKPVSTASRVMAAPETKKGAHAMAMAATAIFEGSRCMVVIVERVVMG